MKDREKKELTKLLENFYENLDCQKDCTWCEYGILRNPNDSYSCPLTLVKDMIYVNFTNPKLWKYLIH